MALGTRILPETQRVLAEASISASYAAVGTAFLHPACFIIFVNFTDAAMQFSLDGIHDHFPLASGATFVFDVSSDRARDTGLFVSQGTVVYVKEIGTPSTGSVYVTPWYITA